MEETLGQELAHIFEDGIAQLENDLEEIVFKIDAFMNDVGHKIISRCPQTGPDSAYKLTEDTSNSSGSGQNSTSKTPEIGEIHPFGRFGEPNEDSQVSNLSLKVKNEIEAIFFDADSRPVFGASGRNGAPKSFFSTRFGAYEPENDPNLPNMIQNGSMNDSNISGFSRDAEFARQNIECMERQLNFEIALKAKKRLLRNSKTFKI